MNVHAPHDQSRWFARGSANAWLAGLLACLVLAAACGVGAAQTNNEGDSAASEEQGTAESDDQYVQSGKKAFDRWFGFPWYDEAQDQLKPIPIRISNFKPSYSFDWLNGVAWLVLALVLAGLAYLIIMAYIGRETGGAQQADGGGARHSPVEVSALEALPFPVRRPTSNLLEEGRRQYELGNYGEAIIYLFSHELVELDRHQLIRLTKGKTNRQYLRELGGARPLAGLLEATMGLFEGVFFGKRGLERSEFETVWQRLGDFNQLVAEATP